MPLLLTLHGTGAGQPSADRAASAMTLRFSNGSATLLDCGDGTTRTLLRQNVDVLAINRVFVSHLHADHWSGLPQLIMGWSTMKRKSPVDLYVPPGRIEFFKEAQLQSMSYNERLGYELRYHELGTTTLEAGWTLDVFPTTHLEKQRGLARKYGAQEEAYGYRIVKGNRTIVFSQDVGNESDMSDHWEGAELVTLESAHIDTRHALELAKAAHVKRLIFTHVPPQRPNFPDSFEGIEWGVANDGDTVQLAE